MNFMHKRIKRFELSGQILDDVFIPRMKQEYIRILSQSMRECGYAQRFDIEPDWTISYTGNHYQFILSVYGSYIGKKNAVCIEGIDKNRPIYTQQSKSGESSQGQEPQLKTK
jgi:hypothetical protein